ncbi:MAG TPA: hypothetical protein VKT80_03720 [Chloroflexota bacterium]|nr:hypothetical protein [Chloroflexota bacterium]
MLSLSNDQLDVSILDPVADRALLGSRYCTGGYIYEVSDRQKGVITSGPGYPVEVPPPVFDGQGLPEAFPSFLWPGVDSVAPDFQPSVGTRMLVIGVGFVRSTRPEEFRLMPVDEPCRWTISRPASGIRMETSQEFEDWSLGLTRDVKLVNRSVISTTTLRNVGRVPVKFRWFPHPFFPDPRGECCKYNVPVTIPDHVGYELLDNGWIATRHERPWTRAGYFLSLNSDATDRLVTLQRHPKLGTIVATCSYAASWLPIWGNIYTFSFEPYLSVSVVPGAEHSWSITYDF